MPMASATLDEQREDAQERQQLREMETRLQRVQAAKQLVRQQLALVAADAARLDAHDKKERVLVETQATRLTRMERLQQDAALKEEQEQAWRQEEERRQREHAEAERARQERTVDVRSDADLENLEAFLAEESAFL